MINDTYMILVDVHIDTNVCTPVIVKEKGRPSIKRESMPVYYRVINCLKGAKTCRACPPHFYTKPANYFISFLNCVEIKMFDWTKIPVPAAEMMHCPVVVLAPFNAGSYNISTEYCRIRPPSFVSESLTENVMCMNLNDHGNRTKSIVVNSCLIGRVQCQFH